MIDPGSWIRKYGRCVAQIATKSEKPIGKFQARLVSHNKTSTTFKVVALDCVAGVKAFDPAKANSLAAFKREVSILANYSNTQLTPNLIGLSKDNAFLVSEWRHGDTLKARLARSNVVALSARLGRWFRSFDDLAIAEPASSNWAEYLTRYGIFHDKCGFDRFQPYLSHIPIAEKRIAKNDAHPSNFIIDDSGELTGLDFEASALKPPGWDLLLSARSLCLIYPDLTREISSALVRGYGTKVGQARPEQMRVLIMVFVLYAGFPDPKELQAGDPH